MSTGFKRSIHNGDADDPSLKRQRTDHQSRVVFVRGLPSDCLESELLALCCPFAVVEKSLMIPPKNQAFVQLPDVASATNLISFYRSRDAMIRGKKVFFEYSTRDEITSRHEQPDAPASQRQPSPRKAVGHEYYQQPPPATMTAPPMQQSQQLQQPQQQYGYAYPQATMAPHAMAAPVEQGIVRRGNVGAPHTILLATVTKIQYDMTAEVLQQVFQKFGNVHKVVTFWKNNEFKSLVQMETVDQAQAAQAALDGRDIYAGCNTLHVVFSRHTELQVRFNNERSRDFTNPDLPTGDSNGAETGYEHEPPESYGQAQLPAPSAAPVGYHQGPPIYRQEEPYHPDPRGPPPSNRPEYDPRGPPPNGREYDSRGPPSAGRSDYDYPPSHGRDRRDRDGRDDRDHGLGPVTRQLPAHSTGRAIRTDDHRSCVLICSNMDSRLVNPKCMFTFFGCFGDVLRVKVMFRKQDTALIQFADDVHSTSALDHLDGVVVYGRKLRIDFSKHTTVSMPRGDVDRFELENTQDFSASPLHRYRRRPTSEAVPPSAVLHVSGIPSQLQRDQNALIDLFARFGYVKSFHYMQKDNKMAILEMGSLDEAVTALLELDNLTYPDSHMRVSFSKASQGPLPVGGGGGGGGGGPPLYMALPTNGYDTYHGGRAGRGDYPPLPRARGRSRSRSRDRGPPLGPRGRIRDRSRDRSRDRGRGGFRDRGGPRGGNRPMGRDNYNRGPPPRRY